MKISSVETVVLSIPFSDGGEGKGLTPAAWNRLDFALIRIDTDTGLTGWGEAFGYFCAEAVKAVVERMIAPILVGEDIADPSQTTQDLQRRLALFGRYGITMFAISGVDIALWDLKAKAANRPLCDLLGSRIRNSVGAYASLVRYGDPGTAAAFTRRALEEGYSHIKLHEIGRDEITACSALRRDASLIIDVNCNWSTAVTREFLPWLAELNVLWLEEPIFPPEDFDTLALLSGIVPLAAGENLCTAYQFEAMLRAGSVTYPQPSVTKVGGITEFVKIARLAANHGLTLMPHSPYFGPGYLATLQLAAAIAEIGLFEYLYVWPESPLYPDLPVPLQGAISIPEGPGLGMDPDAEIVARYRTA